MTAMTDSKTGVAKHKGRITDARGRKVSQLDPVRLHLLNQRSVIPAATLRSMADQLMPGVRRQRLIQVLSMAAAFLLIVGGTIIYFRYFSPRGWTGFDPVSVTIHIVQLVVILSGPVIAFRMARAKYLSRIASVMLEHRHCPHCGYDLRELKPDASDGATVCPECGCVWESGVGKSAAKRPTERPVTRQSGRLCW